nr:ABC transporter permease subunit [Natranaeroarchaeum aerophilus]
MEAEGNQTAAFPVLVDLRYEASGGAGIVEAGAGSDDDTSGTETNGDQEADGDHETDEQETRDDSSEADDETLDGGADDSDDSDDTTDSEDDDPASGDSSDTGNWISDAIAGDSIVDTPAGISPPFPFGSLVLAFLFIIPMNFVIQLYGSSIMNERINRRGELLLVAPVSRGDVIVGKTLPYLAALVLVSVAIALAIDGGPVSIAAVVPIALLFLAATFVGAMFARSFKELTFVTVTISVLLTSYVFVPAIFTEITPIALISPLTLVVWDLQGEAVSALQYTFSTGSFYLLSLLLFGLGAGVYREEDMFSQRSVHLKVLDALANYVSGLKSVAAISALMIPFVFVAQLLTVTVLFALPESFALPVLLLLISCTEEVAKSLHVYAGYAHNRFDRSISTAVAVGAASGLGFFVAEKVTHVAQIVGITQLELGAVAFPTTDGISPTLAVGLFFLPLALHTLTTIVSAIGARRDRVHYLAMLVLAISIHTLYNYVVIFHVQ